MTEQRQWMYCPCCGAKTRLQLLRQTELRASPCSAPSADAARRYRIPMVCAVGMEPAAKQQELREKNGIPADAALYPLQGGYLPDRLRGVQKLMMRMITGKMAKTLAAKADRTPEEDDLLQLMEHGGSRVSLENLSAPIQWCRENLGGAQHE